MPSKPPFAVPNHNRGLVPQLWANYTEPTQPPAENVTCNVARLLCANRAGCGLALQNYALGCTDFIGDLDYGDLDNVRGKRERKGTYDKMYI